MWSRVPDERALWLVGVGIRFDEPEVAEQPADDH
jgi:hypothetical protein